MNTVQLDRRFYEWKEDADEPTHSSYRIRTELGLSDGMFTWSNLLAKRRVVILAEAGSGKTEELKAQAHLQTVAGKFAFYSTVQYVGRGGLKDALGPKDKLRFDDWCKSTEPGWFFIDSIDEAKFDGIKIEQAFRKIAEDILGNEGRTHIVLSGRHTDWEFGRDASRLQDVLPLPRVDITEPIPPLETLIRRVLNYEKPPEPIPAETQLIVVMAPLDPGRVREYAIAKNAPELNALINAIESANMWDFVRRPLDLNWIVGYWRIHRQLGSLTEMIEASLRERVKENDTDRGRHDSLAGERAFHGLERIGAALVFGKQATIAIPEKDAPIQDMGTAIVIDDVLPDWSPEDRMQLLTRPAFDPATFGRARLHNDNQGVVRAYLAARWLCWLWKANLSEENLHALLFSQTYGINLVKPSMQETAAWLSLWDKSVAAEVIQRAPFLLLTGGDPASLSLETRQNALESLIERMRRDEEIPILDYDGLTRFAQPDIAPVLRTIWDADKNHLEISQFVLTLIRLGKLHGCADIAYASSLGEYQDIYTATVAGRALLAVGNARQKQDYADYIKKNYKSISPAIVWHAVDDLFPQLIGIDNLLTILATIQLGDGERGGFNLEWHGDKLAARLKSAADLTRLIEGLLSLFREEQPDLEVGVRSLRETQYAAMLVKAADWLLQLSPLSDAPEAAIDAILYVGNRSFNIALLSQKKEANAVVQLHKTVERRRKAIWRAVTLFGSHSPYYGQSLMNWWKIQYLGLEPGLLHEDIDWLLEDAAKRSSAMERQIAFTLVFDLCFNTGIYDDALKARIAAVVAMHSDLKDIYLDRTTLRRMSPAELKISDNHYLTALKNKQAETDWVNGWIDFVTEMRASPSKLKELLPTTSPNSVDYRIFDLWQLLRQAVPNRTQYAIDTVAPLVEIAGQEVASLFSDRLAEIWRSWRPKLKSTLPSYEKNNINSIDCMCIAGISIEAASHTDWVLGLKEEDAIRAAEFATRELNGYPFWFKELVAKWPMVVESVLAKEAISDFDNSPPDSYYETLNKINRDAESLSHVMAPCLWRELQSRQNLQQKALEPLLSILVCGLSDSDKCDFYTLVLHRFRSIDDPHISDLYLGAAYAINAQGATDALFGKLDQLEDVEKRHLVERVLPKIFGRYAKPWAAVFNVATLEHLVLLAFRYVRVEDDLERPNRGVYTPVQRNHAQDARSAALMRLVETPGSEAFNAIMRLIDLPEFPASRSRVNALAMKRAAIDSDQDRWAADRVFKFEQSALSTDRSLGSYQAVTGSNAGRDINQFTINNNFLAISNGVLPMNTSKEHQPQLPTGQTIEGVAAGGAISQSTEFEGDAQIIRNAQVAGGISQAKRKTAELEFMGLKGTGLLGIAAAVFVILVIKYFAT